MQLVRLLDDFNADSEQSSIAKQITARESLHGGMHRPARTICSLQGVRTLASCGIQMRAVGIIVWYSRIT